MCYKANTSHPCITGKYLSWALTQFSSHVQKKKAEYAITTEQGSKTSSKLGLQRKEGALDALMLDLLLATSPGWDTKTHYDRHSFENGRIWLATIIIKKKDSFHRRTAREALPEIFLMISNFAIFWRLPCVAPPHPRMAHLKRWPSKNKWAFDNIYDLVQLYVRVSLTTSVSWCLCILLMVMLSISLSVDKLFKNRKL